jgi:hypothetical protein
MSENRIERLREGDVVSLWVCDHDGPNLVAGGSLARIKVQAVEMSDLFLKGGDGEGKGAGTSALRQALHLQAAAARKSPFSHFRHRP